MRNSFLKYPVDVGVSIGKEESEFWRRVREDKGF